jgi:chromatin segregation and condensation protein Rec8/ScpA/Scc1 (kleisin family)
MKCINNINCGTPLADEERVKHAYTDPLLQKLVKYPRFKQLFKDLQESPKLAEDAIKKDVNIYLVPEEACRWNY